MRLLDWALIFGHFGLPALGLVGGGVGSSLTWVILCAALIVVVPVRPHLRRFHLFGNWWRFDGERTLAMARLGWPIGVTLALEMGVFALAAYFMGWIGAPAVAGHAVALQLAALTFMVPLGLGQAATVRVGLALGRGDEAGITRAGWAAWGLGVGFMGAMALGVRAFPHWLVTLFLVDVPANAVAIGLAGQLRPASPPLSSWSTARRSSAPECCAVSTTPVGRSSSPSSAIGGSASASAAGSPSAATGRASASGPASPAGSPRSQS